MVRALLFVIIAVSFIGQFYVVAALCFLGSLLYFTGFELVVLAIILDGYFNAFATFPLLTVGVFVAWSVGMLLRERLLLYTRTHETLS